MIPSMVVDLLMQNKINYVKLFSASDNVLEAFSAIDIGLEITVPNQSTQKMKTQADVDEWVVQIIVSHPNVHFTYVCVGTMPLSTRFFNQTYPEAIQVLDWMQQALKLMNKSDIKATMNHFTDVLIPVKKPSEAAFRKDLEPNITRSCQILQSYNAPIGVVIFPLLNVNDLFNGDTEFAFLENNSTSVFKDGDKTYSNVIEVMYDMFDVALEKVGCPNMTIIIDAIGWPTDGIKDGNIPNAQRFYQGLAKFVASKKGTPRRPGPIDVYLHNLSDENKINKNAGSFMRHWGIYKFDGQPKFNFDLQGLGHDVKLVPAIGITHMPKRWCIFNDRYASDIGKVAYNVFDDQAKYACDTADCTALDPGGSCSNLTYIQRLSYAFNVGFQKAAQSVYNKSCYYKGYGKIVSDDPSTPSCTFPVEILAAEIPNFSGYAQSLAHALKPSSISLMIAVVQTLFICFTLMCTC
ncbi:glucan endo-1,3-beta-glucosidase 8-like [Coffea eugenioides]|uniref:glucan endo-1,3-beta-glucosidase 8-like n=1 Tax=Coffea eugenioides TaxID=49369 RepID=UPI000F612C15|nr:glucan endo-1,3-beta-glucosidase 8-like [Coffea eugenioides]